MSFSLNHNNQNQNLVSNDQDAQMKPIVNVAQKTAQISEKTVKMVDNAVEEANQKRYNLLKRWFPDAKTRAIVQNEVMLIKNEFEFRKKALEIIRETQIQSTTEMCNQYLIREKADIRANTAQMLLAKRDELQDKIDFILDGFLDKMEAKIAKAESRQNPRIREIQLAQLEGDMDNFIQIQKTLGDKFQRILSEGV